MMSPIRVVIVDDSVYIRRVLGATLRSSAGIEVVGEAADGGSALELVRRLNPDVVTLDLDLPGENGLQLLADIHATTQSKVVLISGFGGSDALESRARAANADGFLSKYVQDGQPNARDFADRLIARVRAAAKSRVKADSPGDPEPPRMEQGGAPPGRRPAAVIIGASTGGPQAVRELLCELPPDFSAPIVLIQHMPASFTYLLAEQLNRRIQLHVREANSSDRAQAGSVLIAPGDYHLEFVAGAAIRVHERPRIDGHRPSIDLAMTTAARAFGGELAGILLTGMGADGVNGMAAIHQAGGWTFAQEKKSCVVSGMPLRAVARGVVHHVGTPSQIGRELALMCRNPSQPNEVDRRVAPGFSQKSHEHFS